MSEISTDSCSGMEVSNYWMILNIQWADPDWQHANSHPPTNACRESESVHTINWTRDNKEKYFCYKQKHAALYPSVNEHHTNAQHSYKLFMAQNELHASVQ